MASSQVAGFGVQMGIPPHPPHTGPINQSTSFLYFPSPRPGKLDTWRHVVFRKGNARVSVKYRKVEKRNRGCENNDSTMTYPELLEKIIHTCPLFSRFDVDFFFSMNPLAPVDLDSGRSVRKFRTRAKNTETGTFLRIAHLTLPQHPVRRARAFPTVRALDVDPPPDAALVSPHDVTQARRAR